MMKSVNSPFIPKQIETFEDENANYFVMELMEEDMYKYMQQFYQTSKSQMNKLQTELYKKQFKFLIANII